MGTERVRTTYNGAVEGTYTSLPYGDNSAASGTDTDANHYAMLDHDSESGTDHAQFRQYGNTQGRFMSPDPYDGSYDASNPQSFNRYAYALNSPLSYVDPSGLCSTQEYDEGGNPITCIEAWTWRTYMNSIDLDGSMTCSMSQVDCQSYFIMLLLQTSNASLPVSSRPSGGGGGGGGSAAPNNALTYVSKRASCAGQALMQNKLQTGLDALGLIPGEATIIKSGQIAGAVVAGGYSAYQQNMAGTGLSGVGLVMSVLNAEKASIGKNLAEAIPFLGQGVSAVAVGYDIFGSKEYKSCMSGAN
jgi:RHS repeat-associated protein